jgi:hypothetical protein
MSDARAWTQVGDLRSRLQRRWDRGAFLKEHAAGNEFTPVRLKIDGPVVADLVEQLDDVRAWAQRFESDARTRGGEHRFIVESRTIKSRSFGANDVPGRLRIDTFTELCAFLGTADDVAAFDRLRAESQLDVPELDEWIAVHPMLVLEHRADWTGILLVVRWIADRDISDLDVRHLDVPGVDTKFVERHRRILGRLLDEVRPASADPTRRGIAGRLGFRARPSYTRFRLLHPVPELPSLLTELEVRTTELAQLELSVRTVFIVENRASFLAFPDVDDALVIFGGGFQVSALDPLTWLHDREIVYWGDIDTHGFAILDRLRERFPQTRSTLMDLDTLLAHRDHVVIEPSQTTGALTHLTDAEHALYRDLIEHRHGPSVRLEQERIRFSFVRSITSTM